MHARPAIVRLADVTVSEHFLIIIIIYHKMAKRDFY